MYSIVMYIPRIDKAIKMPKDMEIPTLADAKERARSYKHSNPSCVYSIFNNTLHMCEYEI